MAMRGENVRFWLPVVCLAGFAAFVSQKLIRSHVDADVTAPRYEFELKLPGRRGSIYDASGASIPWRSPTPSCASAASRAASRRPSCARSRTRWGWTTGP